MICAKEDHGYPSNWNPTTVGKICEVVGGSTPSRKVPEYWGGPIPWATPSDITSLESIDISATSDNITEPGLRSSAAKVLPAGSVLMTSRATIGYCAINRVPMATNQGFANLICGSEVDSIFMLYWLTHMKPKLKRLASGSTFTELSKRSLRSLAIHLPPMTEQKRIAEILHTCDLATHITKRSIKATKKCKKGLMQRLLTRGIGHTRFKKTKIGEIPESWKTVPFGNLFHIVKGQSYESKFFCDESQGSVLVNLRCIKKKGGFNKEGVKYYCGPIQESSIVKPGELVIANTDLNRAAEVVGYPLFIPEFNTNGNIVISMDISVLKPKTETVDNRFFSHLLTTEKIHNAIRSLADGSTVLHLDLKAVQRVMLPLPSLQEQRQIAGVLTRMDELIQFENQKDEKLRKLRKGLMQVLLIGKVRVKV